MSASTAEASAGAAAMEDGAGSAPAAVDQPKFALESQRRPHCERSSFLAHSSLALLTRSPVSLLSVLSAVKVSQLQNGLRHGDHLRYRRYCTRRIQRLRSALKWTTAGTGGSKSGGGRPRPLPVHLTSPLFLVLLLTSAERSWAYAQQLAGERTEDNPRRRFHQLKRLKRAVDYAGQLDAACLSSADTRTQLQAEAYRADMEGSYAFERGDFTAALQRFLHAKDVYEQLGRVGGSDLAALCDERVAHQHDQIRMSRYFQRQQSQAAGKGGGGEEKVGDGDEDGDVAMPSSSDSASLLSSKLQLLLKEREEKAAAQLDTVAWQDKTVPVSNEKARLILVRLQRLQEEAKARGEKGKESAEEEEADGQRSLASLQQQTANAYEDLGRIAKEDLVEVVSAAAETQRTALDTVAPSTAHQPSTVRPVSRRVSRSWTPTASTCWPSSSSPLSSQAYWPPAWPSSRAITAR